MYEKAKRVEPRPLNEWTLPEWKEAVATQFVHSEQLSEILFYSLNQKANLLLHGPGGHAKSDVVEFALRAFLTEEEYYQQVYMAACGPGMDLEPYQGYTDIKAFQEGRFETVVDETLFFKYRYGVLDEGLSAPKPLLLFMRDMLTRKELCVNGVCHRSKLQQLTICTNVDPSLWAEDDPSSLATLQRFPYQLKVVWPSYTNKDFESLFTTRTGYSQPVFALMAQKAHEMDPNFSPRTAMVALAAYNTFGCSALKYALGVTPEMYEKFQNIEKESAYIVEANRVAKESLKIFMDLQEDNISRDTLADAAISAVALMGDLKKLKIPAGAALYEDVHLTVDRLKRIPSLVKERQSQLPKTVTL